jgi:DNA-directed RNA polymerase subunit RPC12/RpoP
MGTQYDYKCPNCSKECFVDESLVGQNMTCPFCSKEFFATPPAPPSAGSPPPAPEQAPHLTMFDKLPFFKAHRRKLLEEKFDELLRAGPIDENAERILESFAVTINLEPSDVTELRKERFAAEYEPIKRGIESSMWLTDEDLKAVHKLEAKYGIKANVAGEAAICRNIYLLESKGQLPSPITTELLFGVNELAYYFTATTWLQSRVSNLGYAGTSVSVPSGIRGVRFRFGGYTPIKSEAMTPLATGLLYVTSKRLLFNGDRRNTTINLTKIVDGHVYADALRIEKSTGKPDLFSMSPAEGRYILGLIGKLK